MDWEWCASPNPPCLSFEYVEDKMFTVNNGWNCSNRKFVPRGQESWLGGGHRISLHTCTCCTVMLHASCADAEVAFEYMHVALPAMQWHAHKRLFAFLSGNLAPLFLRLQYVLNVFIIRSFVKSLSMPIDSLLTTIFFLETKSLPSIPTKRYESEPDLPKPKLLLPNAGLSNRHCLSIVKTSNRQRRGKLTMSFRLAGWSPRLC